VSGRVGVSVQGRSDRRPAEDDDVNGYLVIAAVSKM
jgi:hypothetical protein